MELGVQGGQGVESVRQSTGEERATQKERAREKAEDA